MYSVNLCSSLFQIATVTLFANSTKTAVPTALEGRLAVLVSLLFLFK